MGSSRLITEDEVRAVLSQVIHPTYGISLVGLDMLRDVEINESGVDIALVMNCPGCPAGQLVLGRAQQALETLLPAGSARVSFRLLPEVWKPPPSLLAENT
jgi:metal-sulfur cluster biosynthetic enzyme